MTRPLFHQGQLDGLCGLYSIVNAVFVLRDDAEPYDEAEGTRLMRVLAESIADRFPRAIWDGVKIGHMRRMLAAADVFTRKRYGAALDWSEPFLRRDIADLTEYRDCLRAEIADGGVAIVGLAPEWDHWTLAVKVTDDRLFIRDSIEIKEIAFSDAGVRLRAKDKPPATPDYVFDVHQVFVLRRGAHIRKVSMSKS